MMIGFHGWVDITERPRETKKHSNKLPAVTPRMPTSVDRSWPAVCTEPRLGDFVQLISEGNRPDFLSELASTHVFTKVDRGLFSQ
jgi:hypothetical protein